MDVCYTSLKPGCAREAATSWAASEKTENMGVHPLSMFLVRDRIIVSRQSRMSSRISSGPSADPSGRRRRA